MRAATTKTTAHAKPDAMKQAHAELAAHHEELSQPHGAVVA